METFTEILKITLPALMVMITAYVVIRSMLKNDQDKRRQEALLQTIKTVTPVKLQAYERIILFLERISPESLIMRIAGPGQSAMELHSALISSIRSEYEHNLSQQIYMSNESWEMVKNARGTVVSLINGIANKLPPSASGEELSRMLIEEVMDLDKEPCRTAVDFIKAELSRIM